mmetsp:Transcript_42874/g.115208  ORF Transcript_42874/g.115208 Transcript_42874/m.115208 type:complete len:204 (+) Transcript_42874:293-904(+)
MHTKGAGRGSRGPQSAARDIAPGGCLSGAAGRKRRRPGQPRQKSSRGWTNCLLLAPPARLTRALGAELTSWLSAPRDVAGVCQRPTSWGEERPMERRRRVGARGLAQCPSAPLRCTSDAAVMPGLPRSPYSRDSDVPDAPSWVLPDIRDSLSLFCKGSSGSSGLGSFHRCTTSQTPRTRPWASNTSGFLDTRLNNWMPTTAAM